MPGQDRSVRVAAASLGGEEGVIVADVTLARARKAVAPPRAHGRWCMKLPWFAFLWPLTQWMGERSYARNDRRKKKARSVAGLSSEFSRMP